MRLLLDTCVWGGSVPELRIAGHDDVWSAIGREDPGDEAILASAHEQRRILVTLDKDFGELAIVLRRPHGGILRLVDLPAKQQAEVCVRILDAHGPELKSGAIVTAERGRLRIRAPGRR